MAITEQDINNLHRLEDYLKSPRNVGEIANYLGVTRAKALDYLEVMVTAPKRYKLHCADLGGVEKAWVIG